MSLVEWASPVPTTDLVALKPGVPDGDPREQQNLLFQFMLSVFYKEGNPRIVAMAS